MQEHCHKTLLHNIVNTFGSLLAMATTVSKRQSGKAPEVATKADPTKQPETESPMPGSPKKPEQQPDPVAALQPDMKRQGIRQDCKGMPVIVMGGELV